jgi:hypothetical protein
MPAKNPLSLIAKELCDELSNLELLREKHHYHQLIHSAVGSVSPEVAGGKDAKIPIFSCLKPENRQYNLHDTAQRAKKCFGVDDFAAMQIAEETVRLLRKKGVGINQVKLLLDPSLKKIRKKAFKALQKNLELNDEGVRLTPKTATLAIGREIPSGPKTAWEDRFSLAATSFSQYGRRTLFEIVTKNECYLWVFPPANHSETSAATMDRYFCEQETPSAEMGMGFSIIQAGWDGPESSPKGNSRHKVVTRYAIFTPFWTWRKSSKLKWRGNILSSTIRDGGSPKTSTPLSSLLPGGLKSLSRIHGCRKCQMFFIDKNPNYPDVPTWCLCPETGKASVVAANISATTHSS